MSAPTRRIAAGGLHAGGRIGGVHTMWEAKAAAGRGDDLARWAAENAPAAAHVYRSADRAVIVAAAPLELPAVPDGLVDSPPRSWDFTKIR